MKRPEINVSLYILIPVIFSGLAVFAIIITYRMMVSYAQ